MFGYSRATSSKLANCVLVGRDAFPEQESPRLATNTVEQIEQNEHIHSSGASHAAVQIQRRYGLSLVERGYSRLTFSQWI
jgi:hypothetical protein